MSHYLVQLKTATGAVIEQFQDDHGLIDHQLIPYSEKVRGIARHIDPYSTTMFNGLQCEELKTEVLTIFPSLDAEQNQVAVRLVKLLDRAASEAHLFVWLLGD